MFARSVERAFPGGKAVWLACLLIALLQTASGAERIRVLLVGQVTPEHCPAPIWFDSEPMVEYSLVPTKYYNVMTLAEAQRFVRLYLPRSREDMAMERFFMFINPYFEPMTVVQIDNMRYAMVETGSGGFQSLGGITIDWASVNWPWVQSSLAPIFPNDPNAYNVWEQHKSTGNQPYKVEVNQDPGLAPVLKMFIPLGIEEVRGYWTIVLIVPQEGATVWGRARGAYVQYSREPPVAWLLSWEYGKSMTWSVADDLDCPWWGDTYYASDQEYGLDIMMNIILHSLGRPLPDDIMLVSTVRDDFERYGARTSTISAFLDFAEKFGADPRRIVEEKTQIDAVMDEARQMYLDGLYQDALDKSEEAHKGLEDLERMAIKLKDQALMWVYIIEWAAVTGTCMITGYVLYALMLKRSLYRQVSVTRASTSER